MLLDANIFQPLIDVFAAVLKFFHNNVGMGWGLAIIVLTVIVRLALVPIGIRQFHSMQRMAQHMPEMKVLREKYKDNPQRLQQETMSFYKENNINPFSSCLPLLIQWPFLIGLFWTLRGNLRLDICPKIQHAWQVKYAAGHHVALRTVGGQTTPCGAHGGSSFLFIHDLTSKPHGVELIILLILYVGTSIGSSMIMMMPGTDPKQRRLMLILPVVFAIITIQFPSGALLYYIVFNLWMVIQQSVLKELIGAQYRHPAGVAIGIPGDGSVSSGGGLRGLFGLSRTKVSEVGGTEVISGQNGTNPGSGLGGIRTPPIGGTEVGRRSRTATAATTEKKAGTTGTASGGATPRSASPPPSPRKKKKRSGRRR